MPIRMTGLNSGLDTETLISELVRAKSAKKDKLVKEQKKLEWKQDVWKELNSKVYSFYSKTLGNMRLTSDYAKKVTKVSNETAASVITGGNAVDGVQTLKINSLAKAGYLTGAELKDDAGNKASYTGSTKLKDIKGMDAAVGEKIKLTVAGKTTEIDITEDMSINDLVSKLQGAGVNASFDTKNQRFFVSSKKTGAENDFTITDGNGNASADLLRNLGLTGGDSKKIAGTKAEIVLNGATFQSETNTFEVNGLTITAQTTSAEEFTITTQNDTDGIYDMVKNFFKEYNALINEMDKLYNADSAKGYEPLTDDEKEAMSETEIEKWEEKIKDALLRKDDTLGNVSSMMKSVMLQGVKMSDGSTLYLSEFGINTLGYFNSADNEKGAYHIDGDKDDTHTASKTDKLKSAIASDPEKVTEFFMTLSRNLYEKLGDMMKTTKYRSVYTIYDDKLMKEEYDDYKTQIARQEELVANYEDRYYKKFTAMETALAKIQSKQSALGGLFGM